MATAGNQAADLQFEHNRKVVEELEEKRKRLSANAIRMKKRFQRTQLAIIIAGAVLVVLGAVQASTFNNSTLTSIVPILQLVISFAAGIGAILLQYLRWQERWSKQRAAAETCKREFSQFLARTAEYTNTNTAEELLRETINKIFDDCNFYDEQEVEG
jgi:hypothetical protein